MVKNKREILQGLERAELDAMVERLARSPRLSNLLRYVGDKYLRGESDQIREHSIAIEVFGRPGDFDPGQDAIARVEAHRLRKKLKQFYELEGKDLAVRIFIPPGSYVPAFKHREALVEPPVALPDQIAVDPLPAVSEVVTPQPVERVTPVRLWRWPVPALYALVIALLLVAVVTALRARSNGTLTAPANKTQADGQNRAPVPSLAIPGTAVGAVRFIAGYSGQPHMDPSGVIWGSDTNFERGGAWTGSRQFVARTNDPFLFQTVRTGEFSYHIPLKPGVYELHLYFAEPYFGPGLGGGELSRNFNVTLNGQSLLAGFDIVSDAMGANIADERIFKDIQPAGDGKLHIGFESVSGKPIVNAIEILPGTPNKQLPIRLTTQQSVYIDHDDQVWSPDNYFLNGQSSLPKPAVTGSRDPGLFTTERFGHFSYAIPVEVRSRYTVVLHFAEFYFGPQASGIGGVGSRVFNVMCNGVMLVENLDIFKEVGSLHALTKTFRHIKPSPQGKLNLTFEPSANYANISAIEVLDESQ